MIRQALVVSLPIFVLSTICLFWTQRYFKTHQSQGYLAKRYLLTLVVVAYASYISLTRAAINVFYCVDVYDGITLDTVDQTHPYWAVDTSVRCFEGSHLYLIIFVAIPVLVFAFVFPLCLATVFVVVRSRGKLNSAWIQETLGLFFRGFEEKYIFWDSTIMLRKALLAAIAVFAYSLGGNLQGLLALFVLILSLFLQATLCPFNSNFEHLNLLESLSLLVNSLTFLCGIILNDERLKSAIIEVGLIVFVLLVNLGLFISFLFFLVAVKVEHIRFGLLGQGVDCELDNGVAVLRAFSILCFEKTREMAGSIVLKGSGKRTTESEETEMELSGCI